MNVYKIKFVGRQVNAQGITYSQTKIVKAVDEESAKEKLYETHEHIRIEKITKIGKS